MLNSFTASNTVTSLSQSTYEVPPPEPIESSLAQYVRNAFIEAENYRRISGVEERLLRSLRARRYQYNPEDRMLIGGIDIYIGLIDLKASAAEAWINDILLSSIDKPWVLQPEPIPDLPDWLKEQVVDALEMEMEEAGIPMDIRQRAKQLKDAALKYAIEKAKNAADGMETLIENQLLNGNWRNVIGELINDFTTFPNCFLRTPVIQNKKRQTWQGNQLIEKVETIYASRRISPFDAYPSLESTDCQDGRYFIERMKLQPEQLYLCLGLDGFNDQRIREVIDKYSETGYEEQLRPDYQRKYLQDTYTPTNTRKTVDTLIYNGKVSGRYLLQENVMVPDEQEQYECEIWTVNNITIKAILNPYPLGKRPLFTTSYRKVPGALWGQGLEDILHNDQRMVNSAARSIVRNMAYSSGPIGEVDVARLGEGEIPNEIVPYKIYHVDPDLSGGNKAAFNFIEVPNVTPMLLEVMDRFTKLADDHSGVPAYVYGNTQVAGAGRTLGGLSMLMGNAAKGIKNSILNLDKDVIEKAITLYYDINMKYDDNVDIKADARIIARGATGLLQRELSQTRTVELLNILTPYIQMGIIDKSGLQVLLREILKTTGLDVDSIIPNPDRLSQLLGELGSTGKVPSIEEMLARANVAAAMQTGTSTPFKLDGRSAPPPSPGNSFLNQPVGGGAPAPTPNNVNPFPMPTNLPQGS